VRKWWVRNEEKEPKPTTTKNDMINTKIRPTNTVAVPLEIHQPDDTNKVYNTKHTLPVRTG